MIAPQHRAVSTTRRYDTRMTPANPAVAWSSDALDALDQLREHSAAGLATIARSLCTLPWLREALGHAENIRCLGLHGIPVHGHESAPWPTVILGVRRPAHEDLRERVALVGIYPNDRGEWRITLQVDRCQPSARFVGGQGEPFSAEEPWSSPAGVGDHPAASVPPAAAS